MVLIVKHFFILRVKSAAFPAMRTCLLVSLMVLNEAFCSVQCSVVMPKDVSAVLGSCAEIPCKFENMGYIANLNGRWIKREPGPGTPNESIIYDSNGPFRQHYNYIGRAEFKGNLEKRQCSLLIKDVRKRDQGAYQFITAITSGRNSITHRIARSEVFLSVLEKPEIAGYGELTAGQTARLSCSVTHNCPDGKLKLKWINYNVSLPPAMDTQDGAEISNENSGSRTVSSVIIFTPSSANDGNILGCTILIDGITTPSAQNFTLEIKYGLEIQTINSSIVAVEGSSLLLYCTAWEKPQVSLSWLKNGEETSRSSTGELKQIFHNIRSEDDNEYWCIAENALCTANCSTQISVQYKPKILIGPNCTSSENWTNCSCRIRANPPGNITWCLNGRRLTGDRSDVDIISWAVKSHLMESSLRFTHPTGTGNLLSCVAANEHGDSVSKYQLHSKGIFSTTIVLIIGGGATGLVILIAVVLMLKIQRKKQGEAARVTEAHDNLVIYSTVHKAVNTDRDHQCTEAGHGAAQSTKPAQNDEIVYATVNFSNFRKHDQYIQNEETCEYAAMKHK